MATRKIRAPEAPPVTGAIVPMSAAPKAATNTECAASRCAAGNASKGSLVIALPSTRRLARHGGRQCETAAQVPSARRDRKNWCYRRFRTIMDDKPRQKLCKDGTTKKKTPYEIENGPDAM